MPAFARGAVPNTNANTANVISISFFPMVDIPYVVGGLNPASSAKLPKKMASDAKAQTLKEKRQLLQILFFVEQREVRFVTSVFHLVDRNEMKGGGVNDVTSSRG